MLIAMACSATKRSDPGELPAIERYDGPMWRTLRAALAELGDKPKPEVWFLSARYGFHPATMPIVNYEGVLTAMRARDLLRIPSSNHLGFVAAVEQSRAVLLAGGELYRDTMRMALRVQGYKHPDLVETNGPGIGHHRAQLRKWIKEHCACPS